MTSDGRGEQVQLPELGQIGIVVKDLDATVKFYSSVLGIGPWKVEEIDIPASTSSRAWKGRLAFVRLGSIEIELIQVIAGKPIHSEFVDRGREGLHHLGFFVGSEEMEDMLEALNQQGIEVTQGGRGRSKGSKYAYLNTSEPGGVVFELIHRTVSGNAE